MSVMHTWGLRMNPPGPASDPQLGAHSRAAGQHAAYRVTVRLQSGLLPPPAPAPPGPARGAGCVVVAGVIWGREGRGRLGPNHYRVRSDQCDSGPAQPGTLRVRTGLAPSDGVKRGVEGRGGAKRCGALQKQRPATPNPPPPRFAVDRRKPPIVVAPTN